MGFLLALVIAGFQIRGAGSPQHHAKSLCSSQCCPGAFAYLIALPFAHDRLHLEHDLVGVRHVSCDEVHAGLDQARDEVSIAIGHQYARARETRFPTLRPRANPVPAKRWKPHCSWLCGKLSGLELTEKAHKPVQKPGSNPAGLRSMANDGGLQNPASACRSRTFQKRKTPPRRVALSNLARLAGIEPTTLGFGGQYSIH